MEGSYHASTAYQLGNGSALAEAACPDAGHRAFLLKILAAGTLVRYRPDRNSPRKSKKAGDFPARKPGEPSVVNVTRYIQFHLLEPWMIA